MTKDFSRLCKDLYEPLVEQSLLKLQAQVNAIPAIYAARRFPLPPGAMYSQIALCYQESLPDRARIIFDSCCKAYRVATRKPSLAAFMQEIVEAISTNKKQLIDDWEHQLCQYNARFNIPNFDAIRDIMSRQIDSEGLRLTRSYSAEAVVFHGDAGVETIPWFQRPIGVVGLAVIGGILVVLLGFVIKEHLGLSL